MDGLATSNIYAPSLPNPHGDRSITVYRYGIIVRYNNSDEILGEAEAYLDIVPTPEGYNHIALFSPASSSTPHFLTSGPWEVVGGIKGVDLEKGLV